MNIILMIAEIFNKIEKSPVGASARPGKVFAFGRIIIVHLRTHVYACVTLHLHVFNEAVERDCQLFKATINSSLCLHRLLPRVRKMPIETIYELIEHK